MLLQEYYAWDEIIYLLRRHRGADDIALVEPYLSIARNMMQNLGRVEYRSGPTAPSAEKYLKRAVTKNEEASPEVRARALLAIGDYYMLVGTYATAHRYYADVWTLMTDTHADDARAIQLEQVNPISRPPPDPYANFEYNPDIEKVSADEYLPGVMVAKFTVNVRGKVQDVSIVEQEPPGFSRMERRLRAGLRDFVYRPRLVDGEPVATPDVLYRLKYHYLPAEYEASLGKDRKLNRPVPPQH